MKSSSISRIAIMFALVLALACDRAPSAVPSLALIPAAVIELEEPDTAPLGMVGGFARTANGDFLIADRQRGTIVRHGHDGRHIAEIGRRGNGPGEWASGPFGIYHYDDSTLAVSDGALIKVFPLVRPTDAWTRTQSPMAAAFTAVDGAILTRRIDRDRRSTLARFRSATDSLEYGGPFPSQVGRNRMVDMMLVWVAAAALPGDSLAVFTAGSDYLFVGPFAGPYDSLHVPALTRRGAMSDVLAAVRDDDPDSGLKAAYQASFPFGVHRLGPTHAVAILTLDQEFKGDRMTGALNVAVANLAARTVCGERRVPVESDPMPWATVDGDSLFVFSHEIDTASMRSAPKVRTFLLKWRDC